jgi:hypothetical protein
MRRTRSSGMAIVNANAAVFAAINQIVRTVRLLCCDSEEDMRLRPEAEDAKAMSGQRASRIYRPG